MINQKIKNNLICQRTSSLMSLNFSFRAQRMAEISPEQTKKRTEWKLITPFGRSSDVMHHLDIGKEQCTKIITWNRKPLQKFVYESHLNKTSCCFQLPCSTLLLYSIPISRRVSNTNCYFCISPVHNNHNIIDGNLLLEGRQWKASCRCAYGC